jgi:hypothetical protein
MDLLHASTWHLSCTGLRCRSRELERLPEFGAAQYLTRVDTKAGLHHRRRGCRKAA